MEPRAVVGHSSEHLVMQITCEQCGTLYEFDANLLAPEGQVTPCPSCGLPLDLGLQSVALGPPEAALSRAVCPQCATIYRFPAASVAAAGYDAACAECQTVFFVAPAPASPSPTEFVQASSLWESQPAPDLVPEDEPEPVLVQPPSPPLAPPVESSPAAGAWQPALELATEEPRAAVGGWEAAPEAALPEVQEALAAAFFAAAEQPSGPHSQADAPELGVALADLERAPAPSAGAPLGAALHEVARVAAPRPSSVDVLSLRPRPARRHLAELDDGGFDDDDFATRLMQRQRHRRLLVWLLLGAAAAAMVIYLQRPAWLPRPLQQWLGFTPTWAAPARAAVSAGQEAMLADTAAAYQQARQHFTEAERLEPRWALAPALAALTHLWEGAGAPGAAAQAKAQERVDHALALAPRDPEVLELAGIVAAGGEPANLQRASDYLRQALEERFGVVGAALDLERPPDLWAPYLQAMVWAGAPDQQKSRQAALAAALRVEPRWQRAGYELAAGLAEAGLKDAARDKLKQILREVPEHAASAALLDRLEKLEQVSNSAASTPGAAPAAPVKAGDLLLPAKAPASPQRRR